MTAHISTLAITLLGTGSLIGLQVSPRDGSLWLAAVLPPWHSGALTRAAATGLPIVDMHLQGRIIVVAASGRPDGINLLRGQGFWVLDATGTALCNDNRKGATDDRID